MVLGPGLVGCALFCEDASVFGEETMEDGPATVTALVHVVALHQKLRRKGWLIAQMAIFELQASFNGLDEAHGVARTTLRLVPERTREVVSTNISEIVFKRHSFIWN